MSMDLPPDLERTGAGAIGAAITALSFFVRRQWALGIAVFVIGALLGYYFGAELGKAWAISDKAGSAIIASLGSISAWKILDGIHAFDSKRAGRELWLGILKKIGLKP